MSAEARQYIYYEKRKTFRRVISVVFDYAEDPTDKEYELTMDFVDNGNQIVRTVSDTYAPQKMNRDSGKYQWVFHTKGGMKKLYTSTIKLTFKLFEDDGETKKEEVLLDNYTTTPLDLNLTTGSKPTQKKAHILNYTYRPGYIKSPTDKYLEPASAPGYLNFLKSDTILKDATEEDFRKAIVETLEAAVDLGLNRDKGKLRAQSYLDMVTWDDRNRNVYRDSANHRQSSCGMLIRNIWWLCGARGDSLMNSNYSGGILTSLRDFDMKNAKRAMNRKTFTPQKGDMIYIWRKDGKQHVFVICDIDKDIKLDENGVATVYEKDSNTLAKKITFSSIDGGQGDGKGPDSTGKGKDKDWNCHGIKRRKRTLSLNSKGQFEYVKRSQVKTTKTGTETVNTEGTIFDGETFIRPIVSWVDIWAARDKFRANRIIPSRIKS